MVAGSGWTGIWILWLHAQASFPPQPIALFHSHTPLGFWNETGQLPMSSQASKLTRKLAL